MTISKTAVGRIFTVTSESVANSFGTAAWCYPEVLRQAGDSYSNCQHQNRYRSFRLLELPNHDVNKLINMPRKVLFWCASFLKMNRKWTRGVSQSSFSRLFPGYSLRMRSNCHRSIYPVIKVSRLDLFCNRIVEWSIDVHFSDVQLMRYMNRMVLINQTLKDEWCAVSADIDNPKEKLMFAFTRIIDAYHLKKRRESIRFPGLLQRAMDNLKAIYINNILFDVKLKGISIKEESHRNIELDEAVVYMENAAKFVN